ncbi:hypothetical protein EOS_17760 [Caballeronia mineralivorans PML1(12)]|uniref:YbaB/EbfC family DNA-binding protein n=1 Tax=Caballeronia mineralivorans PML1(12) TaxID=908627 RepID=A0A0J1CWV3_9BURK|nr:hypothetical protein [Caballeronia mineralivorans]KLU24851.1 hypothetical protein EOS_17760 [Caballeronia mineralivorans PML1(12)]
MNAKNFGTLATWLLALTLCCWEPAWAQSTSPDVAQPWLSYAQLTSRQFQTWLEADDDAANQLHQFLEDRILNAKDDAPPPAIVIRAWIGANGAVTKVEFKSLGDPKADAILRQLLTQHPITEPPPADMPQPLRVRLHMEANPDKSTPASASSDALAGCAATAFA